MLDRTIVAAVKRVLADPEATQEEVDQGGADDDQTAIDGLRRWWKTAQAARLLIRRIPRWRHRRQRLPARRQYLRQQS